MTSFNVIPCELLSWDTDFFCRRIARVCGNTLNQKLAAQIDDWSQKNNIQGLYFLSGLDDPETIKTAEQHGFGLVDVRITFKLIMKDLYESDRSILPEGICIRPFQPADLPGLEAIAVTGHTDTRFFNDSNFPRSLVEGLYSTWIKLESQGRAQIVFVAVNTADQPLGYISCHLDMDRQNGQIGLVGVDPQARGRGIGKSLVLASITWFRNQGINAVTVITQGKNRIAYRLYQRCGFRMQNIELWYHKWYSTPIRNHSADKINGT